MISWEKKQKRQKANSKRSRCPALRIWWGNISIMDVNTTSMARNWAQEEKKRPVGLSTFSGINIFSQKKQKKVNLTCVSRPKRMIMIKKQTAHSWGSGIMAIAWGYVTNARPGPEEESSSAIVTSTACYHTRVLLHAFQIWPPYLIQPLLRWERPAREPWTPAQKRQQIQLPDWCCCSVHTATGCFWKTQQQHEVARIWDGTISAERLDPCSSVVSLTFIGNTCL